MLSGNCCKDLRSEESAAVGRSRGQCYPEALSGSCCKELYSKQLGCCRAVREAMLSEKRHRNSHPEKSSCCRVVMLPLVSTEKAAAGICISADTAAARQPGPAAAAGTFKSADLDVAGRSGHQSCPAAAAGASSPTYSAAARQSDRLVP